MKKNLPRPVRHPLRLNDPVYRRDNCPAVSTQPVRFGGTFSFAAKSELAKCTQGGASLCPGLSPFAPSGRPDRWLIAIYRGLRPRQRVCRPFGPLRQKIATYRGLRPRQRVFQPFGPMGYKMLFTGAFDPGRGCASPSGLWGQKMLLTGAFDPGRGCASPSGLCATRLLLTGAFDPGRGCASPSGLCNHKIATYRGL
jgi:hypothetical protein